MKHPETEKMIASVEEATGYRVTIDVINGIQENAQMISARPGNPVHLIRVNSAHRRYAQCLIDLGQNGEADTILQRVIDMDALSETAELARTARRMIAQETIRDSAGGGLKMDAVFFCLDAMEALHDPVSR